MSGVKRFDSPELLQDKIDEYFNYCDDNNKPYTVSGLALFLDTNRQTLVNYEKEAGYEAFFDTIKKAKARIENYLEEGMLSGKVNVVAGIFNAKNNYGWKDKQEIETNISGNIEVTFSDPDLERFSK